MGSEMCIRDRYEDCDDRFAFIAGYTDGGAPYGVMWEEVGIDPGLPFEEKVKLYRMQMLPLLFVMVERKSSYRKVNC